MPTDIVCLSIVTFKGAVLYLLLVSIPIVFSEVYHFNLGETGLVYNSQIAGSFLGMGISLWGDKMYHRHVGRRGAEARMWTGMAGGVIFPLGCWFFAFTSWPSVHWIVPTIGICITYAGLLLVYLTGESLPRRALNALHASALLAYKLLCFLRKSVQLCGRLLHTVCSVRLVSQ